MTNQGSTPSVLNAEPTHDERDIAPGLLIKVYSQNIPGFDNLSPLDQRLCKSLFANIAHVVSDANNALGEDTMRLLSKRIRNANNAEMVELIDMSINAKRPALERQLPPYVIGILSTENVLYYTVDQIELSEIIVTSDSGHALSRLCGGYDQFHRGRETAFEKSKEYFVSLTDTCIAVRPNYHN